MAVKRKHPEDHERITDLRRKDIRPSSVMKQLSKSCSGRLVSTTTQISEGKESRGREVIKRKKIVKSFT